MPADVELLDRDVARLQPALDEPGGLLDAFRGRGVVADQSFGEGLLVQSARVVTERLGSEPCRGRQASLSPRRPTSHRAVYPDRREHWPCDSRSARSSRASRASSPSRPRSPSPTRRAARSATAASTSRTSSATCRSSRSGGCSWTAHYLPGLPPAEPHPLTIRSGDPRVDVQAALAQLAPEWGLKQLIDISDEQARADLARASVMALSFVAQSARGQGQPPVPQSEIDKAQLDPRALPDPVARRGRPQARQGDRRLLDLGRRARHERIDLHRPHHRLDRRRRRRGAVGRGRRAVGPAARRRAVARAADARRRRAHAATRRATSRARSTAASG